MRYYFAPLEGLTDSIFRSLHHKYFPGVDQYYTPFLSPTVHRSLTARELREMPPADSVGYRLVPQVLTKSSEDFLWLAGQCRDLGYEEINLNLGCPSGTVTAKGKGSGMLLSPDTLDAFLYEIFSRCPIAISIKARIGYHCADEFPELLEIYNRYPIKELTIHPRVRNAFYKGIPDISAYRFAAQNAHAPLCYNGNLCSRPQLDAFHQAFPQTEAVMLGRALIADPGLLSPGGTSRETLEAFYEELFCQYTQTFGSERNAMFRMKENWRYLFCKFEGGEKLWKKLRKSTNAQEYRRITREVFGTLPMREDLNPDW